MYVTGNFDPSHQQQSFPPFSPLRFAGQAALQVAAISSSCLGLGPSLLCYPSILPTPLETRSDLMVLKLTKICTKKLAAYGSSWMLAIVVVIENTLHNEHILYQL